MQQTRRMVARGRHRRHEQRAFHLRPATAGMAIPLARPAAVRMRRQTRQRRRPAAVQRAEFGISATSPAAVLAPMPAMPRSRAPPRRAAERRRCTASISNENIRGLWTRGLLIRRNIADGGSRLLHHLVPGGDLDRNAGPCRRPSTGHQGRLLRPPRTGSASTTTRSCSWHGWHRHGLTGHVGVRHHGHHPLLQANRSQANEPAPEKTCRRHQVGHASSFCRRSTLGRSHRKKSVIAFLALSL